MSDDQDPDQFLEQWRESLKTFEVNNIEDADDWLVPLRDKLYTMICSPMKEEYYHEAFKWISHLCVVRGDFSWLTIGKQWTEKQAKMWSCISRLTTNEITILLPLIQRHLTCGDKVDMEDGKVVARPANAKEYERFGTHLVILENIYKSLVQDQTTEGMNDMTKLLSSNEIITLLDRLKEVMALLCDYLEVVHEHWTQLRQDGDELKKAAAEGALRVMCCWFMEYPESFVPQCKRFLLNHIVRYIRLPDVSFRYDVLTTALHALSSRCLVLAFELEKTEGIQEALEKCAKHIENDYKKDMQVESKRRRAQKLYKLRCGVLKDLVELSSTDY